LTPLAKGRKVEPTAAAFSPDGSVLATAQTARQVRLWDTATGKELQRLTTGTPDPNALINLAFAPDGKVLAVSVGRSLLLWEAATGKPVAIPGADHPLVSAAALSPDGTTFVWGGSDGKLHFCDRSGKEVRTASVSRLPVSSVVFAPDGKTVVATDQDGTSVRV